MIAVGFESVDGLHVRWYATGEALTTAQPFATASAAGARIFGGCPADLIPTVEEAHGRLLLNRHDPLEGIVTHLAEDLGALAEVCS